MNCPLCNTPVADTDVSCPDCDELLSEWRIISGNSQLLRQRGLILAAEEDLYGACLAFMQAALSNPTDITSLVDAGRCLIRLERLHDAARVLMYAHQRSRDSGARDLLDLLESMTSEAPSDDEKPGGKVDGARKSKPRISVAGMPLLGLPVLVRKKRLGGSGVDGVWQSVLHAEQNWKGDWRGLQGWLAAATGVKDTHPALIYTSGLDAWRRDDPREALTHFDTAMSKEASILNPAAWTLYVALMTGEGADNVLDRAVERVGAKGLGAVIDALSSRLGQIDSDAARQALRSLRNIEV